MNLHAFISKNNPTQATTYGMFVLVLAKDMGSLVLNKAHAALGVCGEAGELADAVKKEWAYNTPEDRKNIIEELGDLNFYMTMIQQYYGISDEQIINHNVEKLGIRYKKGYSDKAAQERADKNVPDDLGTLITTVAVEGKVKIPDSPIVEIKEGNAVMVTAGPKVTYRISRSHTDYLNGLFFAGVYDTHAEAIRACKGNAGYYISSAVLDIGSKNKVLVIDNTQLRKDLAELNKQEPV